MPTRMSRITDATKLHSGLGELEHTTGIHINIAGTYFVKLRGEDAGSNVYFNAGDDHEWPVVQLSAAGGGSAISPGDGFIYV